MKMLSEEIILMKGGRQLSEIVANDLIAVGLMWKCAESLLGVLEKKYVFNSCAVRVAAAY
jgi:hypothetical protein